MTYGTTGWALPEQIRRARSVLGLSQTQAAEISGVATSDLEAWEEAQSAPDDEQLWQLANAYGRPVSYFFAPTSEPPRRQDFRSDRPLDPAEEAAARRVAIAQFEELCRVQSALERLVGEDAAEPLAAGLRTQARAIAGGDELAEWLRNRVGLGTRPLKDVRQLLEALGVRVFVVGVPTPALAGTCWWHPEFGPGVLVNRADPEPRRNFTMAHELGHLLRLTSQPICGFLERDSSEERLANSFAAALLLPAADLARVVGELRETEQLAAWDTTDATLDKVARRYGVSKEAASWRLEGLGYLPAGFTAAKRSLWSSRRRFFRSRRGARWRHRLGDLGPRHLKLARRAHEEGRLSLAALADALQIEIDEADALTQSA